MRGVITLLVIVIALAGYMVMAPPAVEGVGEHVKTYDTVDQQGKDTIDNLYVALFQWIPMILIFGMGTWGVVWYIRRNRVIGRF